MRLGDAGEVGRIAASVIDGVKNLRIEDLQAEARGEKGASPKGLIGRLIGGFIKPIYWNEKPFSRNNPSDPKLVVSDQREFQREREQLKEKIRQFHRGGQSGCTKEPHPFFGDLTPPQWSRGMYKHLDHHLRQFGV